ncbi:MerR family transcriptional regulator [Psychromonas sp. 14N.309.X.WAT.B.A12]|uniref:MerR family transcriptional regulator n=1 Tax=unclassified Psychromonas TaxID=2614957 RepID=UPI0025B13FD4|nr:MerR family transcriptional regulator [Psychromonas sp. 14N.309.X.WAT.B.A12]MDN2664713.1 MerR family transcriptional regulator [Psychromonas sp. 14N.309.X.WAT.B.A12]
MNENKPITIGVLAKAANVGVETIRYYQRKAIIKQPPKNNGFRHYSNEDIRVIRLVKKLQGVGFSLDEIKDFLIFDHCCSQSRSVVKHKSLTKIEEIKTQISELQTTIKALEVFSNSCGTDKNIETDCHLLDCFENHWQCCSTEPAPNLTGE